MPKPFPKALVFCNRPLIQFRVCAYNIKINVIMGKLTNSVLGNVGWLIDDYKLVFQPKSWSHYDVISNNNVGISEC